MANEFSGVPQLRLVRLHGIKQPEFTSGCDFGEAQLKDGGELPLWLAIFILGRLSAD